MVWSRSAVRALADLSRRDPAQAHAIRTAVRLYARSGVGAVRKLAGRSGEYRLRAGDWRVVFAFGTAPETGEAAILVLDIGNRRDVYRT
ncbi:MAG: type II toxin-antitoxin system RelE/ParE family toxin [Chloroflexota bacterium]